MCKIRSPYLSIWSLLQILDIAVSFLQCIVSLFQLFQLLPSFSFMFSHFLHILLPWLLIAEIRLTSSNCALLGEDWLCIPRGKVSHVHLFVLAMHSRQSKICSLSYKHTSRLWILLKSRRYWTHKRLPGWWWSPLSFCLILWLSSLLYLLFQFWCKIFGYSTSQPIHEVNWDNWLLSFVGWQSSHH